MSSANNHKRHTLEEEFQRRMFDAEAAPAPDLWARIDHDLTVQENKDYRKRVLFYRQLAAACFVLFALSGTLLAYFYSGGAGEGAVQPGLAVVPEPGAEAAENVTPEAAMEAYMQRHAAPAGLAQALPAEAAAPVAQGKRYQTGTAPGTAIAAAPQGEQGSGNYYNAFAGYSPFLGYGNAANTMASGRGFVSGGYPAGAFQGIGAAPGRAYTQLITWESVTITFGNKQHSSPQQFMGGQDVAARPKSFAEMNETLQASRRQAEQQAKPLEGKLAFEKTPKDESRSRQDSRWSLNLAYTPAYFDQNIGLPEPATSSQHDRMGFSVAGNPVNASQESYQNLSAAREEYQDKTEPAFSYAMEAKAGFRLKEKLKLLVGIGYSESTARTKSSYIVRQFWQKPRSSERYELAPGTIFLSSLNNGFISDSVSIAHTGEAFTTDYKYRHVSVPVGLQYEHSIAKDWFVYAAGGVAANFLIETSVKASNQEVQAMSYTPQDEDSPFRNMQLSGNLSLGMGKRLSPNLTVALGPEVRNYFTTLVAEPEKAMAPQGRPYSLGLTMGVNYQLGGQRK